MNRYLADHADELAVARQRENEARLLAERTLEVLSSDASWRFEASGSHAAADKILAALESYFAAVRLPPRTEDEAVDQARMRLGIGF